ncbi:MAG: hypothetical protein HY057_13510 [Rhodospirillales bacterium]|nr:hypothetical protein [Rhodospirillales bacterium]
MAFSVPSALALALALAAIIVGLAACAPRTEWHKQGASAEALRYDRDTCAAEARNYGFVDRGNEIQGEVYRACMERHGWRRQRGEPAAGK